jgi:hypothetical protein
MHVAQKFEYLLDAYRRPDGHWWTGQQLDEATGRVVTRSYGTNLRKGRIENPGYEKMRAIAKATGFPQSCGSRRRWAAKVGHQRSRRGEASLVGSSISSR